MQFRLLSGEGFQGLGSDFFRRVVSLRIEGGDPGSRVSPWGTSPSASGFWNKSLDKTADMFQIMEIIYM